MMTVENLDYRIIVCEDTILPKFMGKIDVLSPILDLQEEEEKFVLDLHYSVSLKREWDVMDARLLSQRILKNMLSRSEYVQSELKIRLPEFDDSEIIADWKAGLEILEKWPILTASLYWKRIKFN